MGRRQAWLIGYDIASPRRLRRVARFLEGQAVRLQYSLFLGVWTETAFEHMWSGLARLISPRADDVRAWPVPERPWVVTMGVKWPAGVVWTVSRDGGMRGVVARLAEGAEEEGAGEVSDFSDPFLQVLRDESG